MIQYALKCNQDHSFDSWFQSADAFDKLKAAGMVTCVHCGSSEVEKAVMAPRVNAKGRETTALTAPSSEAEAAIAKLRQHVEDNSDYVGRDFAREARAMHAGDSPERAIWGEAHRDDAKKLIEDGVPVAPLPFTPTRKSN